MRPDSGLRYACSSAGQSASNCLVPIGPHRRDFGRPGRKNGPFAQRSRGAFEVMRHLLQIMDELGNIVGRTIDLKTAVNNSIS